MGYFLAAAFRAETFFADFATDFFATGAAFFVAACFFSADFFAERAAAFFAGALAGDFERFAALDCAGALAVALTGS